MNSPRKSGFKPRRDPSYTCAAIGPRTGKLCGLARNHKDDTHIAYRGACMIIEMWPRAKRKGAK